MSHQSPLSTTILSVIVHALALGCSHAGSSSRPPGGQPLHCQISWPITAPVLLGGLLTAHTLYMQASGRPWKLPGLPASSLKNPKLSTSWEQKMQAKREKQQIKEHQAAAVQARKELKTVRLPITSHGCLTTACCQRICTRCGVNRHCKLPNVPYC